MTSYVMFPLSQLSTSSTLGKKTGLRERVTSQRHTERCLKGRDDVDMERDCHRNSCYKERRMQGSDFTDMKHAPVAQTRGDL